MSSTAENPKGPAEAATSPDQGSNSNPAGDMEMNKVTNTTDRMTNPAISRRKALGLMAAVAIPPTAVVAVAAAEPQKISIDDFLARASAAERATYHANALAEVMGEINPDRSWRSHIEHKHCFALIVGDLREVRS